MFASETSVGLAAGFGTKPYGGEGFVREGGGCIDGLASGDRTAAAS